MNYTFPTVFGRNLIEEIKNFVNSPFLVITMKELWPYIQPKLGAADYKVYFVKNTDEKTLLRDLRSHNKINTFVGIGGGQAIDVAKYFAWKTNKPLFQFPSILSVDAMFGHRSAIRREGRVYYRGWACPQSIFFDYDLIKAAPKELNYSGIGDVLCFHTGTLDWIYAHKNNKTKAQWPYNPQLVEISQQKVTNLFENIQEIKSLSDKGIQCLVDAFQWGGLSFYSSGWCPCHIEGIEHFFFYNLEYLSGKKFVHGKPVSLGVYVGSLFHNNRAQEILDAIVEIGLDIRPQSMDLNWDDITRALKSLKEYVINQDLWHSIAHDIEINDTHINTIKQNIEKAYQKNKE